MFRSFAVELNSQCIENRLLPPQFTPLSPFPVYVFHAGGAAFLASFSKLFFPLINMLAGVILVVDLRYSKRTTMYCVWTSLGRVEKFSKGGEENTSDADHIDKQWRSRVEWVSMVIKWNDFKRWLKTFKQTLPNRASTFAWKSQL